MRRRGLRRRRRTPHLADEVGMGCRRLLDVGRRHIRVDDEGEVRSTGWNGDNTRWISPRPCAALATGCVRNTSKPTIGRHVHLGPALPDGSRRNQPAPPWAQGKLRAAGMVPAGASGAACGFPRAPRPPPAPPRHRPWRRRRRRPVRPRPSCAERGGPRGRRPPPPPRPPACRRRTAGLPRTAPRRRCRDRRCARRRRLGWAAAKDA